MAEAQPKTQTPTDEEQSVLGGLGFDIEDEIETEEDVAEVAPEAEEPEAEPAEETQQAAAEPEAQESEEGAEEDAEEGLPEDNLAAFYKMLDQQASELQAQAPAVDPKDRELAEARERERKLLLDRIEELKAQRQTGSEAEPVAEETDEMESALGAAARVLEQRGYDAEQANDLVAVFAELQKIDRESFRKRELTPLQEKLAQAEALREKQTATQGRQREFFSGLERLAGAGPTERGLVQEFVSTLQQDPEAAFKRTPLGAVLLKGWDQKSGQLPPNLVSADAVEMAGRVAAYAIDRAVTNYRKGGAQQSAGSSQDEVQIQAEGGGAKKRSARPRSNKPSAEEREAELAQETFGESSAFADAFEWYKNPDSVFTK